MKILKDVIIYQCEFCGKVSLSRGGLSNHERYCRVKHEYKDGSPCFGCKLLTTRNVKPEEAEEDSPRCFGCDYHDYNVGCCTSDICPTPYVDFVCRLSGKAMYYPPRIAARSKEIQENIIKRCNCAMPKECGDFSPKPNEIQDFSELYNNP